MTLSTLERQEAKLKQLNQKIKAEKSKIEQNLGKQIIKTSNLDYADLSNQKIKDLAQKIATVLNQESNNQL
jgi:molybdopterin converting factor small subunit